MLKVHLEPAQATATPGTALMLTVVVTNEGEHERSCQLRVVGLEAPWVEHSAGELTVPAGSRLEIPIRVTLPHGFPRGETLVGFEVQADGGEPPMVVDTRLAVSDLESLNIGLSPVTVRGGWRGRFRLNIENRGKDPLTIKLSGRGVGPDETKSDLDFTFKPEQITLRPGERVKTRGLVSGKRHVFGGPRRRALTVTAQGETAPRHIQGAFIQRPLMPRNIMRVVGIVLVLALWAGGLSAGVKLTSGKGKSDSAQDAAATVDPAALGGAAGSGGADGANGTGGEEAAAPAAGGAIAGQVKGPTDASGITVKLRPVALADDLSDDLAASNVSFVSSSTEEAPKESAQTLRREPTGPVGPTATTTTDADGRWAFGGLKTPANYEVTFSKAGFAERTYVVSVDDAAPTVNIDVPMVPGNGSLSGTVKGPDGPLGGAIVTVTDGTVTFRVTTPDSGDDAGTWKVDGLTTPASYLVTASLRGYGTESTSLSLDSGAAKDGIDLTMIPGVGSISGHISGAGGKLGNITVTATNGDVTRTASTLTEGDPGAFSLPQLPIPGDYTINVTGAGWIPQTMALALKGNASKVDLDLVKTTATIVGTVKDAAGQALASTGVTLAADKPIVKTLSAIDPAGTYELSGLAPGTYTLTFDRADFKSESTIVTVGSGDRKSVDMTLTAQTGDKIPKDAVVRGIVRSQTTGAPISAVEVSTGALSATSTATATASATVATDATGGFVLDKLAPGSYDLKFTSPKYQPLIRTVRIGAKSDTTIDVTMLILGGVQGVITDLTATPIANVAVTVTNDPTATGQAAFSVTTTTDASGQYSLLEQLPTGKYVATFSKTGFQTRSRNFEAASGTVAVGDAQLIELGGIHGTIQKPDTSVSGGFSPLTGVNLTVERSQGGVWSTIQTLTTTTSEYEIVNLAPGDYRITATASGYGTVVKTIDDLQLRETRDGGIVLSPGAQTVAGRLSYTDAGTNTVRALVGATVTASIITSYDTLSIFPFIQPHVSSVTATTNSLGDWSITGQLNGTTGSYTYTGPGLSTVTISNVTAPITSGALDRTLSPNPRNLTGTVALNTTSGALPSIADVRLYGGTGPTAIDVTVHPNSSGAFSFSNIRPGTYSLDYSASNFAPAPDVITVPPGDQAVPVTIPTKTLQEYASIAPHLTTGNGTTPLAGVLVTLTGPTGRTATTNASGDIAGGFALLTPGAYTVTYHKAGYIDVSKSFTVSSGENATATSRAAQLAISLLQLPDLTINATHELDAATPALTTATVTARALDSGGNPTGSTLTATGNGSGAYVFTDLSPGNYRVTATATGHDDAVISSITMAADVDQSQGVNLKTWTPLRVHVRSNFNSATTDLTGVASNVTAVRTLDANGNAVTGQPTVAFTEGAGGIYTAALAPPGTYTITANPSTHIAQTAVRAVVAGTTTAQDSLTLDQLPRISITTRKKLDGSFSSLTTATVTVTPSAGGAAATVSHTGGTNLYVADSLQPGDYDITVTATDHDPQTFTNVTLAAAQSYTNTVDLLAWAKLSIHLQTHFGSSTGNLTSAASDVHAVRIKNAAGVAVTGQPTVSFTGGTGGIYTSSVNAQPGTYTITADPSTHVSGSVDAVSVAGDTPTQVDLTIEQLPRITITTNSRLDGSNSALNTATVAVSHSGGSAVSVTHTGGTNTYVADGLTAGNYDITVSGTGHDSQTFTNVAVAAGQDYTQTVNLLAWTPLTLHLQSHFGTATADMTTAAASITAVRTLDAGDNPVTGQPTITFTGGTNGIYTSSGNVVPGTYAITASPTTHVSGSVNKKVVAGTTPSDAQLTIEQKPRITITVNSRLDSSNSALNTATVTVSHSGGAAVTVTHAGGTNTFVADSLTAGNYDITVSGTDHDTQTFTNVAIASGDDYTQTVNLLAWTPIAVHLQTHLGSSTTNLTGVASSVTAVRTHDAGGNPVTGQPTVTFTGGTGGIYTSSGNVPPGRYTITASPTNHVSGSVSGVQAVAGTTPTQADLTVEHLPEITITTRTKLGSTTSALNAATVTIVRQGGSAVTVTHPGGTATHTATNLAVATYDITVSADDGLHDDQTFSVTLVGGQSYSNTIDLLEWTPISVRLQGEFNSVLSNLTSNAADVTAQRTADALGAPLTGEPTIAFSGGSGGVYTSTTKVEPGTYTITASPSGYDPNTVDVTAVAGTTPAQASLIVQKLPALTITVNSVLDGTPTPLTGATVTVQKLKSDWSCCAGGSSPISPTSAAGGSYEFDGLAAGKYQIVVTAANNVSQTFTGDPATFPTTGGLQVTSGVSASKTVNLLQHPPLTLTVTGRNGATAPFNTASALPGATATMTATSGGSTFTFSDAGGGTYTKANVVPGTYTLTVSAPGYGTSTPQTGIVIAGGVTHAALSEVLTATPGTISGTVTESIGSTPLAGVTVEATFSGVTYTTTTNASGAYSIANVQPATWSVKYSKATYSDLTKSVTVTRATTSTSNAVLVQLGEQISGTTYGYATDPAVITDGTDNPQTALAGVLVTISRPGFTATQTSAGDGTYTFADIPATSGANDYTISFTHDKYVTRSVAKTTTVAGSSTRTDSLIAHSGTATVTVKDLEASANPLLVQNASIRLSGVLLSTPLTSSSAADGTVTFSSVPPGTYSVSLVTPPSGYLASATTVPLTMPLSPGIVATDLLGSGTATADYSIQKAVSLDVTVGGLVNSDKASVTVSWDAGAGTSTKNNLSNGVTTFTDLPPGKAFTVQASATHYTGGSGSSAAVTLGGTGTATATLVPDKATVQVTVTGLLGADTTTVIIDGRTSTALANNGTYTFTTLITPGVSLPVTFGNANYNSTTSNIGPLDAGGSYTGGTGFAVTVSPKDGSVAITISGLQYGEKATLTVTGANPQVINNLTNGVTTVSNLTAGVANTFTLTATNYTNPAGTSVTLDANENTPARPISIALTRETATLDVTSTNLGTDTADITVTWPTGGTTTVAGVVNGSTTHITVPSGVLLTITSTHTGTHGTPATATTTITAGGTDTKTLDFT